MKLLVLGLLVALPVVFVQSEFEVIYERLEVIRFDTSYVGFAATHNFKYNRSQAATNFTFHLKKHFGHEVVVEIQSYKFSSNEYRLFPIRFMFNFCDFVSKNEFGLKDMLEHCGNFTYACPILKQGWYYICNSAPNSRKFPPHIPQGSYKHDLKLFYRSIEILFLQCYGTVKYPDLWKITFGR